MTHGRGNPSGAKLSLTILRVEPGPIAAETLPQRAARSKARDCNRDIRVQKTGEEEAECEKRKGNRGAENVKPALNWFYTTITDVGGVLLIMIMSPARVGASRGRSDLPTPLRG
jgi:hypothetical protein